MNIVLTSAEQHFYLSTVADLLAKGERVRVHRVFVPGSMLTDGDITMAINANPACIWIDASMLAKVTHFLDVRNNTDIEIRCLPDGNLKTQNVR